MTEQTPEQTAVAQDAGETVPGSAEAKPEETAAQDAPKTPLETPPDPSAQDPAATVETSPAEEFPPVEEPAPMSAALRGIPAGPPLHPRTDPARQHR